ncbi:unnamed protein product [Ilex paraguariensis]|uniref:Uncharacterized protein n=1 Tax=Ilex paraguariensis TaxID=185542 RepID=A0ABC8UB83_9AQUA
MEIDEMPSIERDDMIPLGRIDVDNILRDQSMENVDEEDDNFINISDIEGDSCSITLWPDRGNKELQGVVEDNYPYCFWVGFISILEKTQGRANGGTLPLAQKSHYSTSVHTVLLQEGHVEHNAFMFSTKSSTNIIHTFSLESSSMRRKWGPTQNIALAKKKQADEKLNVEMLEELG